MIHEKLEGRIEFRGHNTYFGVGERQSFVTLGRLICLLWKINGLFWREGERCKHPWSEPYLPQEIQQVALRKLRMLNRAVALNDLRIPPANRLEKLRGDRAGQHSIRINERWRICFEWRKGDAYNVEIVDYH